MIIVGMILAKMGSALILRMITNVSVNLVIKEKSVTRKNAPMAMLEKIVIKVSKSQNIYFFSCLQFLQRTIEKSSISGLAS